MSWLWAIQPQRARSRALCGSGTTLRTNHRRGHGTRSLRPWPKSVLNTSFHLLVLIHMVGTKPPGLTSLASWEAPDREVPWKAEAVPSRGLCGLPV